MGGYGWEEKILGIASNASRDQLLASTRMLSRWTNFSDLERDDRNKNVCDYLHEGPPI